MSGTRVQEAQAERLKEFDGDISYVEAIKVLWELLLSIEKFEPKVHNGWVLPQHTQIASRFVSFHAVASVWQMTPENTPQLVQNYENGRRLLRANLAALEQSFGGKASPEFFDAQQLAFSCLCWSEEECHVQLSSENA
jgi:hypothetical protein